MGLRSQRRAFLSFSSTPSLWQALHSLISLKGAFSMLHWTTLSLDILCKIYEGNRRFLTSASPSALGVLYTWVSGQGFPQRPYLGPDRTWRVQAGAAYFFRCQLNFVTYRWASWVQLHLSLPVWQLSTALKETDSWFCFFLAFAQMGLWPLPQV